MKDKLPPLIMEGLLKDGRTARLTYHTDAEGDNNRGWQVDQIEASVGGMPAGYLKISLITLDRLQRYYPTVLHYQQLIGGWHLGLGIDKWETQAEPPLKILRKASSYGRSYSFGKELSEEEVLTFTQKSLSEKTEKFFDFYRFHVERPLVDYISVYEAGETHRGIGWKKESAEHSISVENFRGLGLAGILYKAGAVWSARNNRCLYASGCQSDAAKVVWQHIESGAPGYQFGKEPHRMLFAKDGQDGPKERRFLDVRSSEQKMLAEARLTKFEKEFFGPMFKKDWVRKWYAQELKRLAEVKRASPKDESASVSPTIEAAPASRHKIRP